MCFGWCSVILCVSCSVVYCCVFRVVCGNTVFHVVWCIAVCFVWCGVLLCV